MDCGTCPSSGEAVVLQVPEQIECEVSITASASKRLSEAFDGESNSALLIGVLSGGCSGYMYDLQIVEEVDVECQEMQVEGFRVLIPNSVSNLLNGIEIDYEDRLMGGGFKINNPNANRSCGCGESFG